MAVEGTVNWNRQTSWLLTLCLTQAGAVLVFNNFAGAQPIIQQAWGLSNAQSGAILAAQQVGYVIAVLVLSSLTDYVGPKPIITGGALTAGLCSIALPLLASQPLSLMLWRAGSGVGIAGIYMPGVRLIAQQAPAARRGQAMGLFVSAFTLGSALSMAMSGWLAASRGWQAAFIYPGLSALAVGMLAWGMLPPFTPSSPAKTSIAQQAVLVMLRRNRQARFALETYVAHAWELLGLRAWLATYLTAALTDHGVSLDIATRQGATAAGIATLIGAGATALTGTLSDRWGRIRTIRIVTALGLGCTLLAGLSLRFPWPITVALGILAAIVSNADSAVISTAFTECVPSPILGRALALYAFSGFSAGALSPLAFGAALDLAPAPFTGPVLSPWSLGFATLALGALGGFLSAQALETPHLPHHDLQL